MKPFHYLRAGSADEARRLVAPGVHFVAGGTSLLDLMKLGVEAPASLLDLNRAHDLNRIEEDPSGGLRVGATVRMSKLAAYPGLARRFPVLHHGLLAGATPQLRNMASVAGSLLQRARCVYFRDLAFPECNKRFPGSGCGARDGVHTEHAVFGWSETCVAVHPSDLAVALLSLDAAVITDRRTLLLESLHRLPDQDATRETHLAPGELVLALQVPGSARALRSAYAKSPPAGGFAVASAAVALELDAAGVIVSARVALGGVAHVPWRAARTEAALVGQKADATVFATAADAELAAARPLRDNAYKVPLARALLLQALTQAAQT